MNSALVAKAILDRIKADTGAGGLYAGGAFNLISGAYWHQATPGTLAFPYLVYSVEWKRGHTFTSVGAAVTVNVAVYENAQSGLANLSAVEARLIGDAALQSNKRPTYGFDDHLLVLDTGATNPLALVGGDVIVDGGSISPDTENVVRMDMSFTTEIQAPKA